MMIRIAGIVEDSIVDGPGLRLTIFVQGCPHRCPGCHNSHTWDFDGGIEMDVDELIGMLDRNPLLSGVTISGGEPFSTFTSGWMPLAQEAKRRGLSVWAYTGYTYEGLMERYGQSHVEGMLRHVDVLVDGRYIEELRTLDLPWRGSKNQRLIDVRKSLREGRAVEWDGGADDD